MNSSTVRYYGHRKNARGQWVGTRALVGGSLFGEETGTTYPNRKAAEHATGEANMALQNERNGTSFTPDWSWVDGR